MDNQTAESVPHEPPLPDTVLLSEWAIAAGRLGCPLTVQFQGFEAHTLAGLWAHLAVRAGRGAVLPIEGAACLRRLRTAPSKYALALVRDARLYTASAWAARISVETEGADEAEGTAAVPTIFTTAVPDPEDDPATTLTLHPHPDEVGRVAALFAGVRPSNLEPIRPAPVPRETTLLMQAAFAASVESLRPSARDCAIVWPLWIGAVGLRGCGPSPAEQVATAYAEVYRSLRGKSARPPDEVFKPLAVAMVGRANVYLRAASNEAKEGGAPERADVTAGITRRELIDLGRPNGSTVTALVGGLRKSNKLNEYCQLGLKDTTPPKVWASEDVSELVGRLLPWTEKQVRSHFTKLLASQDIEGVRPAQNGAWSYRLPEALTAARRTFDTLPDPAVVTAAARAAAATVTGADGPDGPPSALAPGPTEELSD